MEEGEGGREGEYCDRANAAEGKKKVKNYMCVSETGEEIGRGCDDKIWKGVFVSIDWDVICGCGATYIGREGEIRPLLSAGSLAACQAPIHCMRQ